MIGALLRQLRLAVGYSALGALLLALAVLVHFLLADPRPQPWHEIDLREEFMSERAAELRTLADYRSLEQRLQREIDENIRSRLEAGQRHRFNRFHAGSASDPRRWPVDWNQTFELPAGNPRGAALLLHGLSDSPYSLRALGRALNEEGLVVVGLRLPGHGTVPSGLRDVSMEDMQAAVRLAARDLAGRLVAGQPFYLVGYSNGAALAVDYSLQILEGGSELPAVSGLILISPAIGVTPFAALGRIRLGASALPGLGKLAWQAISAEYDPFKYSSFPWNAVGLVHRMTRSIAARTRTLAASGRIDGFPRTLVFLSTVDATVRAEAVVDVLLEHLHPGGHELVLFDVNRYAEAAPLLVRDPGPLTERLLELESRPYALTVLTNASTASNAVQAVEAAAGGQAPVRRDTGLSWPTGVLSLSHVALPFPPDDPLYGYASVSHADDGLVHLGHVALRAELGVLAVPESLLIRMRSNPFYPWMEQRIRRFVTP